MEALRFVIMTLIAFTLARPEFVRLIVETEEPEIVVLTDGSGSMATRDVVLAAEDVIERETWLAGVQATNFWRPLEGEAKVMLEEFDRPSTNAPGSNTVAGTDLNASLAAVLQRQQHLKAVLLLTDGDWNQGESPVNAAIQYRSRNVPIYTVRVGREMPLPDLVLEEVSAPSYGLLGEQISIPFRVQSFLPRDVRTTVALTSVAGVDVRKDITIPAFGEVQSSLVWSPQALGSYSLNMGLPAEADEYLADNNDKHLRIAVRTEKLRVLVVESLPRWEYRFLRNALSRDPGVEVDCLLMHPGMERGEGRDYIRTFPRTRELISKYDVVFVGDVGIGEGELTEEDAELLRGLVEQQGSGLVFMPGMRGRQLTLAETALGELLPVIYDRGSRVGLSSQLESTLQLTSLGRDHFLTMLTSDASWNEAIWKGLPGFYWCAAVEKGRPGGQVLAVHSGRRNESGRLPLLVTRPFGNGEVLFMGTDSAWRWRRGVEDTYHYRFWGQVVRWMSHKRHMARGEGMRLAFNPENPQVGNNVFLQATLSDPGGALAGKERVRAEVLSPSGASETLEFAPVAGGWGVYQSDFRPREGGSYRIVVSGEISKRQLEADILVERPKLEKLGQPANRSALEEIARVTRGVAGSIEDLDRIVSEISLLPEAEPLERRVQLWANPWWGGLILLLLVIYWTARKVAGMI